MYITGDLLGENESSSVIKLNVFFLKMFSLVINSCICSEENLGAVNITADLLGENESSSVI